MRSHYQQLRGDSNEAAVRETEVVRIELLGGFRLWVGPRVIQEDRWRLRKARSLIKLLALAEGHRLHREQVMETLWPGLDPRLAANNLHQILHAARRALDPSTLASSGSASSTSYLFLREEQLTLCPESPLWVDAEAFEEAAANARHAPLVPQAFRAAIDLYAGELLPEDRYEVWVEQRRAELRNLYISLLFEVATLSEEHGEFGEAIEALGRVVAEEPTHEGAHVGLMRLDALLGRRREALGQYENLRRTLSKELGTEPEAATTSLQQQIWAGTFPPDDSPPVGIPPGEETPSPPAVVHPRRRHNLPLARTSFIGRERETLEVKRQLAMTRLLTLTGAGGSGKTRSALEVARDLIGVYPDGVWLVELASLSEEALVPQAVAKAVKVPEQPGRSLTEALVDALRKKKLLLVLDNCEHLIEGVAQLVDAHLSTCPHLRVLATSREPLGVEGELVWRVDPLSVPSADPDHRAPAAGELARYEAVRLFVERARLRSPHFEIRAENAGAVAQICRRLEGMPLAVELAAARVRTLSLEQIAQRLGDSLKLLRGNSRTVPQRQRTLRATLEWSYDLLSPEEQVLLGRLSVFAGGWSLEMAEAVVSGGEIKKGDVLELLSGLINKSLAETSMTADEALRYGMLEPVRHYARERLKASGEAEEIARLHAEYFLNLAEEAEPQVEGTRQRAWLERLEEEHDNLRVALSWSLERDDAELGLRMGSALGEFWYLREHFGEGLGWLEEALARSGRAPTAARARALYRVSWLSCLQGNLDRAQEASEEGLVLEGVELFRTGGGDSVAAELRRTLGIAVSECGDFELATELLEESLALSRVVKSGRGAAISLLCLGNVLRAQDDFGRATELYEEALTLCRESGDPVLLAQILSHLGYTLLLQGKLERAMALSEQAVEILRAQKHRSYLAYALSNLGRAALLRGNHEQAKASYKESLTLCRELGDPLPGRSHHPREVDGQSSRTVARVEDSHAGKVVAAESFEGLACATGAEAERAARLFGIAQAVRERVGSRQDPKAQALREPYLASARSRRAEAAWEKAFMEGRAMGMEEAVEYALSEEEETDLPMTPAPEQPSAAQPPVALTNREEEIALLVGRGLTNRQIAQELSISERTVENHIAKILKKLGFSSRTRIAAWVAQR